MASQLVIFRAFLFYFFVPLTLDLKKIPVNQLIKKIWPYKELYCFRLFCPSICRGHSNLSHF